MSFFGEKDFQKSGCLKMVVQRPRDVSCDKRRVLLEPHLSEMTLTVRDPLSTGKYH